MYICNDENSPLAGDGHNMFKHTQTKTLPALSTETATSNTGLYLIVATTLWWRVSNVWSGVPDDCVPSNTWILLVFFSEL